MRDDIVTRITDFLTGKDINKKYDKILGLVDDIKQSAKADADELTALRADRDSLRKALDDRYAADQRAAKAIFAETGRTSGFPSVKEVVAFYVAEVERLEKAREDRPWIEKQRSDIMRKMGIELFGWKCDANEQTNRRILAEADRDSLRAKLDRAKDALKPFAERVWKDASGAYCYHTPGATEDDYKNARTVLSELSELSADAPAQQTGFFFKRYVNGVRMAEDVRIEHAATLEEAIPKAARLCQERNNTVLVYSPIESNLDEAAAANNPLPDAPAQQTQIRNEVREAMVEPTKPGYYWAKASFVKEHAQKWEIVDVRESEVLIFGGEMSFDLDDFTFGTQVTKPEGLE